MEERQRKRTGGKKIEQVQMGEMWTYRKRPRGPGVGGLLGASRKSQCHKELAETACADHSARYPDKVRREAAGLRCRIGYPGDEFRGKDGGWTVGQLKVETIAAHKGRQSAERKQTNQKR